MRSFRVRDLMINVMPQGEQLELACPTFASGCGSPITYVHCVNYDTRPCNNVFSRPYCRYFYTPVCPNYFSPIVGCPGVSLPDPVSDLCPYQLTDLVRITPVINELPGVNLPALRAQLQQALAEVETQEQTAQARLRPQSEAEVDALIEKMSAGLEELQALKAELQQRSSSDAG